MRLHRQYGYGLRNLASTMNGYRGQSPNEDSDPSSTGASDKEVTVNDIDINPYHWKSLPLGFIAGLQYNNETFGKCFFAMTDTVGFYDYFVADVNLLLTEGNFYQLFVYDPLRLSSTLAALSE